MGRGGEGAQRGRGGLEVVMGVGRRRRMIGILAVVETRLVAQDNRQGGRGGAARVRLAAAALLPLAVLQQRHLVGREGPPLDCCSAQDDARSSSLQQENETPCDISCANGSRTCTETCPAFAFPFLQQSPHVFLEKEVDIYVNGCNRILLLPENTYSGHLV